MVGVGAFDDPLLSVVLHKASPFRRGGGLYAGEVYGRHNTARSLDGPKWRDARAYGRIRDPPIRVCPTFDIYRARVLKNPCKRLDTPLSLNFLYRFLS